MQQHINATTEALKAAPAVIGTGYTFAGLPLSEWAALLTCIYVAVQLGFFLHDRYVIWRSKRDSQQPEPPQS